MQFGIPSEFGKRFGFPENAEPMLDADRGSVVYRMAVQMVEQYEDAIVQRIAMEAKAAGVASVTVLNKAAILEALNKQIPTRPKKSGARADLCPCCNRFINRHEHRHGNLDIPYCKWCGQALDWSEIDV